MDLAASSVIGGPPRITGISKKAIFCRFPTKANAGGGWTRRGILTVRVKHLFLAGDGKAVKIFLRFHQTGNSIRLIHLEGDDGFGRDQAWMFLLLKVPATGLDKASFRDFKSFITQLMIPLRP